MTLPSTLGEFFEKAQLTAHIYSIGRRVQPYSHAAFKQFEEQFIAWETPVKGTARVAFVIQSDDQAASEAVVWCLAFPLDELGLIVPDARDGLLRRLVEQLGSRPQGEALQDPMKDNPLAFKPDPYSLAALHSRVYQQLQLPVSPHLANAQAFYSGKNSAPDEGGELDWAALDYQSVADLCLYLDDELSEAIARNLGKLPEAPLQALCRMLEHFPTENSALQQALAARANEDSAHRIDCIRALLSSTGEIAGEFLDALLTTHCSMEELAAISAKGWQLLEHDTRLKHYLDALAKEPSFDFAACVRDLAQLPRLRLLVIMTLQHAPDGSLLKQRLYESMPSINS